MKGTRRSGIVTGVLISIWLFSGFSLLSLLPFNIAKLTIRTLTGIFGLVILFMGIFYSLRRAKLESGGENFPFIKALKIGISISLIVAVIVSLFSFIYIYALNPGFTSKMVGETETLLQHKGLNSDEITTKLNAARQEFSPLGQFLQGLIVQSVAGTIFSLMLSLILRTKKAN